MYIAKLKIKYKGMSESEVLRDNNLDNNDSAIEKNVQKINKLLLPIQVSVQDITRYVDSTLFILTPKSMNCQDAVRGLFRNHHRYTFEYADVVTNEIIDGENGYIGRIPGRSRSMAIRRIAFKKLPRPIMCSFILQTFLFSLLSVILYVMYCVALI